MQEAQHHMIPALISVKTISVRTGGSGTDSVGRGDAAELRMLPCTTSVIIRKAALADGARLQIEVSSRAAKAGDREVLALTTVSEYYMPGNAEADPTGWFAAGQEMVTGAIGHHRGVVSTHIGQTMPQFRLYTDVPAEVVTQVVLEQMF
jgi:hypothetical protein